MIKKRWKGWIWAGGLDYIVSPVRYAASGKMRERVAKTVDMSKAGIRHGSLQDKINGSACIPAENSNPKYSST